MRFEVGEQTLADRAVEYPVGVGAVVEGERQVEHRHLRRQAAEVRRAGHLHVDGAAADPGNHRLVVAEHTVAEGAHLQFTL
ncbi:hypothetical protein D3C80_2066720 [compost metagenome]